MNDAELDQYLSGSATIDVAHSDPSFALSGRGKLSGQGIGAAGQVKRRSVEKSRIEKPLDKLSAATMTEEELQNNIIKLAQVLGWLVHAELKARVKKDGQEVWRTQVQGTKGYPDLTLARDRVLLLRELKSEKGKVSDEQAEWLEESGGKIWRPSSWLSGQVEKELR